MVGSTLVSFEVNATHSNLLAQVVVHLLSDSLVLHKALLRYSRHAHLVEEAGSFQHAQVQVCKEHVADLCHFLLELLEVAGHDHVHDALTLIVRNEDPDGDC